MIVRSRLPFIVGSEAAVFLVWGRQKRIDKGKRHTFSFVDESMAWQSFLFHEDVAKR